MMMKILFSLIILASFLVSVQAVNPLIDITITNKSINYQGFVQYQSGPFNGKAQANFFTPFNDTLTISIRCPGNLTGNYSNITDASSCYPELSYFKEIEMSFNDTSSVSVSDTSLQNKYAECINLKAMEEAQLQTCLSSLKSNDNYKENFTACSTALTICNNDKTTSINSLTADKTKCETDLKNNDNQRWVYGIIGLALGAVGYYFIKVKPAGPSLYGKEMYNREGAQ